MRSCGHNDEGQSVSENKENLLDGTQMCDGGRMVNEGEGEGEGGAATYDGKWLS